VSVCRQVVFIFPFALIFAALAKQNSEYMWTIWTTFPIGELLSAIVAFFLFKRIYNKIGT
jgi:Na+-driven multidrug efflux pump